MTLMKSFRMLNGIFASLLSILGGGVAIPLCLWMVWKLNIGIKIKN